MSLPEIWKLGTGDAFFLTSGTLSASGRMLIALLKDQLFGAGLFWDFWASLGGLFVV